jgi:hypothetical protein
MLPLFATPRACGNKNNNDNGEGDGAGVDEVGNKIQGCKLTLMPNLEKPHIPNFDLRPSAGRKCCPCLPPPVLEAIKKITTMVRVMMWAFMRSKKYSSKIGALTGGFCR